MCRVNSFPVSETCIVQSDFYMIEINSLYRYPVKGLGAEKLSAVKLTKGNGIELDRYWALKTSEQDFDRESPRFLPKRNFLQLLSQPELARLRCGFAEGTSVLTLDAGQGVKVSGDLATPQGRQRVVEFVFQILEGGLDSSVELIYAPCHHFSDIPQKAVSIINLASVREMSRLAGTFIDPLRFRGNIYVDGIDAWSEREWVGKTLSVDGTAILKADEEIGRCKATHVNLDNGNRDISVLDVLRENYGHTICGIYATTICPDATMLRPGDKLSISSV